MSLSSYAHFDASSKPNFKLFGISDGNALGCGTGQNFIHSEFDVEQRSTSGLLEIETV